MSAAELDVSEARALVLGAAALLDGYFGAGVEGPEGDEPAEAARLLVHLAARKLPPLIKA